MAVYNQVAWSRSINLTIGAGLAGTPISVPIQIPEDSEFLVQKITGWSTGVYDIKVNNPVLNRDYSNLPIRNSCYVGTALRPQILNPYMVWHRGSTVNTEFTDRTNLANNIWITYTGTRRFSPEITPSMVSVIPYVYNAVPNNTPYIIPGGATDNTCTFRIDAGKFQLIKLIGDITGNLSILWRVDGENPNYNRVDEPMHSASVLGTAQNPYILDKPLDFMPRVTSILTLVELAGLPTTVTCIAFHGKQIITFV